MHAAPMAAHEMLNLLWVNGVLTRRDTMALQLDLTVVAAKALQEDIETR
jgi:hypothetical protein